jgi:hypothetical protein
VRRWPEARDRLRAEPGTMHQTVWRTAHRCLRITCGALRHLARRSTRSGISGLPQSGPIENDQSVVAISPGTPAAQGRCIRAPWRPGRRSNTSEIACGGSAGVRGAGDRELTVGMHRLHAGRRDPRSSAARRSRRCGSASGLGRACRTVASLELAAQPASTHP